MVNGMPGPMAVEVAQACLRRSGSALQPTRPHHRKVNPCLVPADNFWLSLRLAWWLSRVSLCQGPEAVPLGADGAAQPGTGVRRQGRTGRTTTNGGGSGCVCDRGDGWEHADGDGRSGSTRGITTEGVGPS
jgi:hypothetical protein